MAILKVVKEVNDADFEAEVLNASIPTLVDFWAPWCAPCRVISPIVEELSDKLAEKLQVAKLNVDENPKIPQRYKIFAIPTLILFKAGSEVHRIVGLKAKEAIESELTQFLE